MNRSEFVEATSRIEQYYDKEYTTQQLQIMFEELSSLPVERYRQLISAVIKKSKYMPKIADIMEANVEIPYTNKEIDDENVECKKCNSTGIVTYIKKIDGMQYIFGARCNCKNGLKEPQTIPSVNEIGI